MIEVEWAKMTAPELKAIAAKPDALAILPVGALEQHGPHLPVMTDTISASAVAIRAARNVSHDMPVAVLPGLWLGMSEHHFPFGGTISVDHQTYYAIFNSVVRSLKALGFSRLLIVNGHGGNIDSLSIAARELAVTYAMPIVATTPWMLAREETSALFDSKAPGHACEGETSVIMAVAGDLVRDDKLSDAVSKTDAGQAPFAGFSRFYSFAERAPTTGTLGDPRLASQQKGEAVLAIQERLLVEAIRNPALWSQPDQVWEPNRGQGTTSGAHVAAQPKG
ncbi:creatininase family protein [Brucellaceae bacterium C25G]